MMTNREAIKIIEDKVRWLPTCPDIVREALDVAISALQAQELNCDGCVYQEVADRFVDPCIRCKRNCIDYWKGGDDE